MIDKIKENIKNNYMNYIVIFFMLLAMTSFFAVNRYSADTYYLEVYGAKNNAIHPYFENGRFFQTAFLYLMGVFNISFPILKLVSWSIAFISLYLSIILVYNFINKHKKNNLFTLILSFCLVINPFIVEYFMFPEYTGIMCLEILFSFISIIFMIKFIDDKKLKKYLFLSLLFAILSVMCYQGAIALIFIIPIVFVMRKTSFKDFFKNVLSVGVVFSITSLTTAIISKILGANRLGLEMTIMTKLSSLIVGVDNLLTTTFRILPNYLFLILFIISLILIIIIMMKQKKSLYIVFFICDLIAILIVPAIPHFFTASTWMVPRSCLGYGMLAIIPILFYCIHLKESKFLNINFILIMSVLLLFQLGDFLSLAKNQIQNDANTIVESKYVYENITDFEIKNNTNITKIKGYVDSNVTYSIDNIKAVGDINIRAYAYNWIVNSALSNYSGKIYYEGEEDKEVQKYCSNHNWDKMDKEQFIFKNDTLYICLY